MAKKSKKQTRKVSGAGASAASGPTSNEAPTSASLVSRGFGSDFNPDYSQTLKDLRRIGVLAGTFFVVLLIISFFLR
jgi:hypothetical protein